VGSTEPAGRHADVSSEGPREGGLRLEAALESDVDERLVVSISRRQISESRRFHT
jgi:hypothetical protein